MEHDFAMLTLAWSWEQFLQQTKNTIDWMVIGVTFYLAFEDCAESVDLQLSLSNYSFCKNVPGMLF